MLGDAAIFGKVVAELFTMSKTAFEISLGLTGVLAFWLGIMKVGEQAGAVQMLARWVDPLFSRLFPGVPSGHPAVGSMLMNISANMLGLDNAATPMGLKAMKELQTLNPGSRDRDRRAGALPHAQRQRAHAHSREHHDLPGPARRRQPVGCVPAHPAGHFLQHPGRAGLGELLPEGQPAPPGGAGLDHRPDHRGAGHAVVLRPPHGAQQLGATSSLVSGLVLFGLVVAFLALAVWRKVQAFEAFVEGAKEGFQTAVTVIPYLVAILVGIAVFRASGGMDWLMKGVAAAAGRDGRGQRHRARAAHRA